MKHFLDLSQIDKLELREILNEAKKIKSNYSKNKKVFVTENSNAINKLLLMIFEKPSTRTRLSFDLAMRQLGGQTIVINSSDMHLGKGEETIEDTAKVISGFSDIVMLRTFEHKTLNELSKLREVPLINGLTNHSHPCQLLSDILTFEEKKGSIVGAKIAWVGDGNNVSNSAIEAAVQFNFSLNLCVPKNYMPSKKILSWAKSNKGNIEIFNDPITGIKGVDCIMTDKWISMGDKVNKNKKKKALKKFQINNKLLKYAKNDCLFMHVLPASRGDEVTDTVMDGKNSVVWDQAENRLHSQKAIINWCLS